MITLGSWLRLEMSGALLLHGRRGICCRFFASFTLAEHGALSKADHKYRYAEISIAGECT